VESDKSQIEKAALGLDARSRASLAEKLLRSLDDLSEEESDALWAEEAARRDAEMDRNEGASRFAEDVLRDIRARLR
jgi:glycerol-3-phosphate O-acyltransferase